jgi:hypothetical protein
VLQAKMEDLTHRVFAVAPAHLVYNLVLPRREPPCLRAGREEAR